MNPPGAESEPSRRAVWVAGLVVLGCVALCGVAGTCLFILTLFLPTQIQ